MRPVIWFNFLFVLPALQTLCARGFGALIKNFPVQEKCEKTCTELIFDWSRRTQITCPSCALTFFLTKAPYLYSKGLWESVLMDWLAYSGR